MTLMISTAAAEAAACPVAPFVARPDPARALYQAAGLLLPYIERGRALDAKALRASMETATRGSDAGGAWTWKDAYEACEAAQVLFLRKFSPAMRARAASPAARLAMMTKIAALMPSQTRRSEQQTKLQQFSTPLALGYAASVAAAITPDDLVLEPSAGTGLLAIFAELDGARLVLNELAETRAGLLTHLFPSVPITRHDAAHIHDHLDASVRPTVVLMNPPFSAAANVVGRMKGEDVRHITSALARLAEGGRLVAITGANVSPEHPAWRDAFVRLQERGRVVFTAAISGDLYARHGTTAETRLTVIDRVPAEDPVVLPASSGIAPDAATLLKWVIRSVPPRQATNTTPSARIQAPAPALTPSLRKDSSRLAHRGASASACRQARSAASAAVELAYESRAETSSETGGLTDALYEGYELQSIRIPSALPHPTKLVQSAAMASVAPPKPSYRPHLPEAVIADGLLSDAQLESVILAGEAHAGHLAGLWLVDEARDTISAAPEDAKDAVRFRRGFFLGDGTGAGKGRQVAGVILDNWLKSRRRALWISKSDALLEDARRDWSALGQEPLLVTSLSRFKQGMPIPITEGILFATYATLRSAERGGKASRVQQIVD